MLYFRHEVSVYKFKKEKKMVEVTGWLRSEVGTLLASGVMLFCYIWWLNSKFEELTELLKSKK